MLLAAPPGRHSLFVSASGYLPADQQVALVRGRGNATVLALELKSQFGFLQIDSDPSGAQVEVRDSRGKVAERGTTPFHSSRLVADNYRVVVTKGLCRPAELQVKVPDGDRVTRPEAVKLEAQAGSEGLQRLERYRQLLAQPLKRLATERCSADAGCRILCTGAGAKITVDMKSLSDAGVDLQKPLNVQVQGGTFGAALTTALNELELTYVPEFDGLIFVCKSPAKAPRKAAL